MGRLEGKSVIITGAGSGIGRAASLLFTKEGARLIAVDRADGVKETVAQIQKAGGKYPGPEEFIKIMASIKLDAPRGPVQRVINIVDLGKVIPVFPSMELALGSIRAGTPC